ncbi:MAG: oligosaccharide flippase family protein [Lachnospiraceae bacterium]|nr:oligosaccharide flippase family protein [Lachnospiraceae bacterium]
MEEMQIKNKVVKAGAGYVIGNYLLKGITFLSAPIFTRLLSTDEYGIFGAYISYEAILYIIIGLALHSSIANAKYEYKDKYNEYISSVIVLVLLNTFLWMIIANVFYGGFHKLLSLSRPVLNILILHCFGTAMLQFFNSYVSLNYSVKEFLKLTSINALGNMGLSILLILTIFQNSRLNGRIIGTALPLIGIAIYIVIYFFKKCRPVINRQYWKFAIYYSAPIIPHGISQVILSSFDRIMIKDLVGAAAAGLYNFAFTINSLVVVVSTSLDKVWKPWFYERMNEKDYKTIGKRGVEYAFGMAQFTAVVLMLAPEVVKILGAREYWGTTPCVVPVLLGGYFTFVYMLPVLVEYFYSKTKFIAVGSMLAAVLNVVLNYIFIPRYGYIAAAYTTMFTHFLYFLFHYILAAKIHGHSLFSTSKMFFISAGIVAVGAVAMLLEKYFIVRWLIALIFAAFSMWWADKNFGVIRVIKKKLGKAE